MSLESKRVASICRAARLGADMVQTEWADALDCTVKHVSHLETGRTDPSLRILRLMGEISGMGIEIMLRPRDGRD